MPDDCYECEECGDEIDMDDEVQSQFAIVEYDQILCAHCNSDQAE